jgi:hypothetical protein
MADLKPRSVRGGALMPSGGLAWPKNMACSTAKMGGVARKPMYFGALGDESLSTQEAMRFRLTYEGELRPGQRDPDSGQWDRLAEHKQHIRKCFHRQLKYLWQTNRFLRDHKMHPAAYNNPNWVTYPTSGASWGDDKSDYRPMFEVIANNFRENGYSFVPLIRSELSLICSLNILFLRRDIPGSVVSAGDLDNRIKTLIDALRRPQSANELRGNETPGDGEDPFYCLLEDDKLVTQLSVETDTLLEPPTEGSVEQHRQVRLIITVELKPYDVTMFNLSFA